MEKTHRSGSTAVTYVHGNISRKYIQEKTESMEPPTEGHSAFTLMDGPGLYSYPQPLPVRLMDD